MPKADVFTTAQEIALRIAGHPQAAIRIEMESFQRAEDLDRDNALALAEHMYRLQRRVSMVPNTDIQYKKLA